MSTAEGRLVSWDGGFTGGVIQVPAYQEGMSLTEYLMMVLAALAVTYSRQALEYLYKSIPDDATGIQAIVREVAKALSGYRKNREHAEDDDRPEYLGKPKDPPPP